MTNADANANATDANTNANASNGDNDDDDNDLQHFNGRPRSWDLSTSAHGRSKCQT
jgi:hypothetical protein